MLKKTTTDLWSMLLLFLIIIVFFGHLFYSQSIFINPDFGRSDLIHFNIPIRYSMALSLKQFQLPLWEPRIGQGFPVFAEGQIGLFYLPNLIFFFILPFDIAFNLGYVFAFSIAAIGTYLFCRSIGLTHFPSILAGITYAFCPTLILRLHHYNFLQAASLLPFYFLLVSLFFNTRKIFYLLCLSLIVSQQIFIGFPQITFYSVLACTIYILFNLKFKKSRIQSPFKIIALFTLVILLGIVIGTLQLAGTYELSKNSLRTEAIDPLKILRDFPFNPQNLLTIFDPFALGSVKDGTYPQWVAGSWGIFWENNAYFGLVPLSLIFLLTLFLSLNRLRRKYIRITVFFLSLASLGILLSLGAYGPLHPIFSIPPFNFFRVPSRFLIYTFFSAAVLAAIALNEFQSSKRIGMLSFSINIQGKKTSNIRKGIVILITAIAIFDIFRVWYSYPLTTSTSSLFKTPESIEGLFLDKRLAAFGVLKDWNEVFLHSNWHESKKSYLFFKNYMAQNSNILFGQSNVLSYSGMSPKRIDLIDALLSGTVQVGEDKVVISHQGQNILNFSNVGYLAVPEIIDSEDWVQQKKIEHEGRSIYLYKNIKVLDHLYLVQNYTVHPTFDEIVNRLKDPSFNPNDAVILEKDPKLNLEKNMEGNSAKIVDYKSTKVKISASLNSAAILVLSDSFYPGWKAKVNGKNQEIFSANLNSRALVLEKGKHEVIFYYEPVYFPIASSISLGSLALTVGAIYITKKRGTAI